MPGGPLGWEESGRRGGKSGRFRHRVQAGACPALPRSGSRQRCGVQAGESPVFLGGCCFCGRARRTGGAVQDGGASLRGGGFFLRGAGTDGESRTGRESGRPAGEADVPGGPGSREGEVGAFAADRCHRTEVRKRGVDSPGDSRRKQPGIAPEPERAPGAKRGEVPGPGQRQARSRAGMRRRGACFPAGVMVSAGGGRASLGGPKEGRRGRETGLAPPSECR